MDETIDTLDGSTVIWAIMAVTGLWLLGLFVVAIGYTLFECLGPCNAPAPTWVWWMSLAVAAGAFVLSGRVAAGMTRLRWTWLAAAPGLLFVVVVAI